MALTQTRDPRGQILDDDASIALIDNPDSTEEIPTLDFGPYLDGRPGGREAVAAHLREITMTVGFFYLKNHGIPQSLIDAVFAESKRFHAIPLEKKAELSFVDTDGFKSGYIGFATEKRKVNVNIVADTKPNIYEQITVQREGAGNINRWPELPGFKETVNEYHRAIEKLARSFLPLWSTSLKLPLDFFDRWFVNPHLQLSLLHYPPQKEVGNRQYGIAPHTDNAMMTFLAQENIPGLAVRMPSGRWRAVDIVPGTLLVNTGNALVRWTNELYLSTKHRVINTSNVDRYSIPVFFGPQDDTVLEVLPPCKSEDQPSLYEPVTYGDLRRWYYNKPKT
ncbi:isopenicillin N synthase family dioxygenase [Peristeroidobacter soli]|uniref:isopenicillin N synthase family dioxygenase n=1 Tax=Peristeroidobacter soli TaxID=2497877 RepID=UPI00101D1D3F|nr:2-oxoglutarate and iron-dependent oxygenase domain-containing protein [Peristeroidobacter soli]